MAHVVPWMNGGGLTTKTDIFLSDEFNELISYLPLSVKLAMKARDDTYLFLLYCPASDEAEKPSNNFKSIVG